MLLWHFIFSIIFFVYKIESAKIRPNFDEIFGDGWDKDGSDQTVKSELKKQNKNLKFVNFLQPNGDEMGNDPIDQMNGSNDQNILKSVQSYKKNETDQQKRETVKKFDAIKEKLREKGKYQRKDQSKIETKIAKLLGTNRKLIQKWKNELNLNKSKIKKRFYDAKKRKFIERIDEFIELNGQGKQKEFMKELGICEFTFQKWKKELLPKYYKSQKNHNNEDRLEKLKKYYEIKEKNPKMSDVIIAKELEISRNTLINWKKQLATTN